MTREEQIKEMAEVMCYGCANKMCEEETPCDAVIEQATFLYDEGYRKTCTSDLATDTQKAFKEGYEKGVEDMRDQLGDVKNHADTFYEENVRLTELTVWQAKKIKELEEKLNGER